MSDYEIYEPCYHVLEEAMANGFTVERCTIDQNGEAVNWTAVDPEKDELRAFHPDRYRIAKCDPYEDRSVGLTFNDLRDANIRRISSSVYSECEAHWQTAHWVQALVGEVGELANILKKIDRGDYTLKDTRLNVAFELGDIQAYLDILALKLGIDLGSATRDKFNVVSKRIGSPVFLE